MPAPDDLRIRFIKQVVPMYDDPYFGEYLKRIVKVGRELVETGRVEEQVASHAFIYAAELFRDASENYQQQATTLRDEALQEHVQNVLDGVIKVFDQRARVTKGNAIKQVDKASKYLAHPKVQSAIAQINYGAFFNARTMASAVRTLDRSQIAALLETADSTNEAMPHLTVTNWAIGQIAAGVYERFSQKTHDKGVRFVDVGSGPGATMAAITSCIRQLEGLSTPAAMSMTAIEPTQAFFDELEAFADSEPILGELGLRTQVGSIVDSYRDPEFGKVTMINDDVDAAFSYLSAGEWDRTTDLVVVTANYSFHRLPPATKEKIGKVLSKFKNVVVIIGDLIDNTSSINTKYFDLAVNGPFNTGNRGLRRMIRGRHNSQFDQVDFKTQTPETLDVRLLERVLRDSQFDDGHMFVFYKGELATECLGLVEHGLDMPGPALV